MTVGAILPVGSDGLGPNPQTASGAAAAAQRNAALRDIITRPQAFNRTTEVDCACPSAGELFMCGDEKFGEHEAACANFGLGCQIEGAIVDGIRVGLRCGLEAGRAPWGFEEFA